MNSLLMSLLILAAGVVHADEPKIAPAPIIDPATDEISFRNPAAYPKQRLVASAQLRSVAGTHSANSNDFSFRGSGVGFGLAYEYHLSPRWSAALEYQRLDLRVENSQASATSVLASTAQLDSLALSARYCLFGNSNFFQQICPGLETLHDAYPILMPSTPATFGVGRIYDLVVGPTVSYQSPVSDQIVFRAIAGYAFGTGFGPSDALAPRSDTRYYLRLGGRWEPITHHSLGAAVEWINRSITVRDTNSSDLETTKSTDLGLRVSYGYTF